ncbi:jg19043 [Pararge aegeria aegeria]|uniref:Jg19043 protein n=1 Tax=Pararge aegeria aegeria TaxID=348720 RepID=A0A8S4R6B2_9NEOP|nr:jg19043 [Pararge aegeria aegeria]
MATRPREEAVGSVPLVTEEEMDQARDPCVLGRQHRGPMVSLFPKSWKEGKLCLLRKEGRPLDSPAAYRPIELLSDTGKLFKKILAACLTLHLEMMGPGLSEVQYGFRTGRSTLDALDVGRFTVSLLIECLLDSNTSPAPTGCSQIKYKLCSEFYNIASCEKLQ